MEPRSIERGNRQSYISVFKVNRQLQWSHAQLTWKHIEAHQLQLANKQLQWSHAQLSVETAVQSVERNLLARGFNGATLN